jgi:TRAP-type C4-dicarboxylate transport system permease small subunit
LKKELQLNSSISQAACFAGRLTFIKMGRVQMKLFKKPAIFLIDHFEEIIVVICMFGIVILTFTAVIARYVFRMPIAGADEVATYMFLWASLFGAAAAFKYNKHGGVPILVDFLPTKIRRTSDLFILSITAAFFGFLSYYSWKFLNQSMRVGQTSPATGIPVWTVNAGIFAALCMCSIRCVIAIVRDLIGMSRYPNVPVSSNIISEDNLGSTPKS